MGGAGVVDALYRLARAPGIVATLGPLLDEDLALGGGELTWRAGPLRKALACITAFRKGYTCCLRDRRRAGLMRARASPCTRWSSCNPSAIHFGRAVSGLRSTSPTASTLAAPFQSRDTLCIGAEISIG